MKNWPTVEQLESMEFSSLEDAVKAIAALPPEDEDRTLFIASYADMEYPTVFRAGNVERAKLIAAATSSQREDEMLWKLPAGLPGDAVLPLSTCFMLAKAGDRECFDALFGALLSIGAVQHSGPKPEAPRKLDDEFLTFVHERATMHVKKTEEFWAEIERTEGPGARALFESASA